MKTKSKKPKLLHAYCWRTGRIGFGYSIPEGALPIAQGKAGTVRDIVRGLARTSYPSKPGHKDTCLLVPGLPEARTLSSAFKAVFRFRKQFNKRLNRQARLPS